jgi:hypothetical protein
MHPHLTSPVKGEEQLKECLASLVRHKRLELMEIKKLFG